MTDSADHRVRIERVEDGEGFAGAWAVRMEVFVVEQEVPVELERDELDAVATHWMARLDGEPVGTVRLVEEPDGVAHLGRLAVRKLARGTGLGGRLVRVVEEEARARGLTRCVLGAQVRAMPFYERLGYEGYGEIFDDAGIPHRWMARSL